MPLVDRCDLVALEIVVSATLFGGLLANAWSVSFIIGAGLGNTASWLL